MNEVNSNGLHKLTINLSDGKGNKETATARIQWDGGFSASIFRKVIQTKVVAWVKRVDAKHTVNRGTKLTINVNFMNEDFVSQPIYFGGQVDTDKFKAERQLKEQLLFFVDDIKEKVS